MKLRDLLQKCSYKKTFNAIYSNYYLNRSYNQSDIIELDLAYLNVYQALINLPESKSIQYDLVLKSVSSEGEKFIDVLLLDKLSNEEFGVDFVPWSELIDGDVIVDPKIDLTQALCHILWEITFWGFSEKEISKQRKATLESKEEVIDFDLNSLNNVLL
jgi:hypothetical protein